jgi:uncharacterized membrane protein YbhN (UPF0104 family)
VVWYVDPQALLAQLRKIDLFWFFLATLASIVANLVSASRWCVIARLLGLAAPYWPMVAMYFRGVTMNVLLPGATVSGDLLRSYALSKKDNPLLRSGLSVLLDRLSGLWMLCALSLLSLLGAAGIGLLTRVNNQGFYLYVGLLAVSLVMPWVPVPVRKLEEIRKNAIESEGPLLSSAWLSAGVQVASSFALWLCGVAAGVQLSYPLMLAAAAPIFIMAAIPLGWAGFGARELSAVVVLGLLGVPADQATTCALLYGLAAVVQGALSAPLFILKE